MPTNTLESQLKSRINAFAAELSDLVREAALEAVQGALGDGAAPTKRRGPGRPPGSATRRKKKPGRPAGHRKPGRPRTKPVASTAAVLAQVNEADGIGVTEIAASLGMNSDAVKPVMVELLASKHVRKTGVRRGTKYHGKGAGAGVGAVAGGKKATKKKARRKGGKKRGGRRKTATNRTTKAGA
jgi:hypothetical protein